MILKTILFSLLALVSACEVQAGKPNHLAPAKPVTLDQYKRSFESSSQPAAEATEPKPGGYMTTKEQEAYYLINQPGWKLQPAPIDKNGNVCQIGTCWDEHGHELNR